MQDDKLFRTEVSSTDEYADLPAAVAAMSDALDTPSASAAVDRLLRDARQGRPDDDCTAAVIRRPG